MSRFRVSGATKARHYMAFSGLGLPASPAIACGSVGEKPAASRGDFTSSEDDNVLVQGVSSDKLALRFIPYAYGPPAFSCASHCCYR